MDEQKGLLPSPWLQTGNAEARTWAENRTLVEIIEEWGRKNDWRYRLGCLAVCFSIAGTFA